MRFRRYRVRSFANPTEDITSCLSHCAYNCSSDKQYYNVPDGCRYEFILIWNILPRWIQYNKRRAHNTRVLCTFELLVDYYCGISISWRIYSRSYTRTTWYIDVVFGGDAAGVSVRARETCPSVQSSKDNNSSFRPPFPTPKPSPMKPQTPRRPPCQRLFKGNLIRSDTSRWK